MRYLLSILLLLSASPVFAVICKTVDAQGVVGYSDVPANECAHQVKLPKPSTYAPLPLPANTDGRGGAAKKQAKKVGYTSMQIMQPTNNGNVHSNQGRVPVSIALQPALQKGDRIQVTLDGVRIQPPFAGQSGILTGVTRGTHSLSAAVVDSAGKPLIQATEVSFTLHKRAIGPAIPRSSAGSGSTSGQTPAGGSANSSQAPNYTGSYSPQNGAGYTPSAPDYKPSYATPPNTPGRDNSAFKPHY